MQIFYVTNSRLPTEKAHGLATMKLSEAFAKEGIKVKIFAPWRFNKIKSDPFKYYNVEKIFEIKKIPSIDFLPLKIFDSLAFYIQLFSFSFFVTLYLLLRHFHSLKNIIFFSHDHMPLFFLSFFAPNIFYDIHDFPTKNIFYRRVLKKSTGISVQTNWKIEELNRHFNIPNSKIIYWPNGTDVDYFAQSINRDFARQKLFLDLNKNIIIYTGHLYNWKGVDILAESAKQFDKNILFVFVGGTEKDVKRFRNKNKEIKNIIIIGHRPHEEILFWLKSADVLILPNTAKEDISKFYTSPMKLFEYMASGRPIIASRVPSITEILTDKNAVLVEPDNPDALAEGIKFLLDNPKIAFHLAKLAQEKSRQYTWSNRAQKILSFIKTICKIGEF